MVGLTTDRELVVNDVNPYESPHAQSKRGATRVQSRPGLKGIWEALAWPIVGYVIGLLAGALGDAGTDILRYRGHGVFHDVARAMQPLPWSGACLGALYGCRRLRWPCKLVILTFGAAGYIFGWLVSGYVYANPGPNYTTHKWDVPLWCLVRTLVGSVLATLLSARRKGPLGDGNR